MQLGIGYIIILGFCLIGVFSFVCWCCTYDEYNCFHKLFSRMLCTCCRILIRPTVIYIYVGFTKCVSDFYLILYSSALLYDDN